MFAIVEVAAQQHKVTPAQKLFVPLLSGKVGDTVKFDRVLLISDDSSVKVGNPIVAGAHVTAKILTHAQDETVIVFKKKRRKGYRLRKGHRQQYTQIEITSIA